MVNIQHLNIVKNRSLVLTIIIIIILVGINLILGSWMRGSLEDVLWWTDDVYHISWGYSFKEHNDLLTTFLPYDSLSDNAEDQIKSSPVISEPEKAKGPVFFILLGSFYKLLDTTAKDLYFHASLFSNLVSSCFIVVFFLFVNSRFNLKIAAISSVIISFIPFFVWSSPHVTPDSGLLFLFSISALFFLEKKKIHYFLFGIFTGLAHLTHPFGIVLGMAYFSFLFIKREFRGSLIVLLSWHLVLIPWFLRNYFYFRDIGYGLFIPYSEKISSLLSFLPHKSDVMVPFGAGQISIVSGSDINLYDNLVGMFQNLATKYYTDYLFLFVVVFSIFVFFKTSKLNIKSLGIGCLAIAGIATIYYVNNPLVQFCSMFIVTPLLIYVLYKKRNSIFEKEIPRLYFFIAFFMVTSLLFYYISAVKMQWTYPDVPDSRQIMFAIFLMVPLALVGFEKITSHILSNRNNKFLKILPILALILIFIPIAIHMKDGIVYDYNFETLTSTFPPESSVDKQVHEWIRNNVPSNETVGSTYPEATFLKTGLQAIALPLYDQENTEMLFTYYKVSYLIYYNNHVIYYNNHLVATPDVLKSYFTEMYNYKTVYSKDGDIVIQLTYRFSSDPILKHASDIIQNAILLENKGSIESSTDLFKQIYQKAQEQENMGNLHSAIVIYKMAALDDHFYNDAMMSIIRDYTRLQQNDLVKKTYDSQIGELENISVGGRFSHMDHVYVQKTLLTVLNEKALFLLSIKDYDGAIDTYTEIIRQNMFDKNAHLQRALLLEKMGRYDETIQDYDFLSHFDEYRVQSLKKIDEIKHNHT